MPEGRGSMLYVASSAIRTLLILQAVLFKLAIKGGASDIQHRGRESPVALRNFHCVQDGCFLDFREWKYLLFDVVENGRRSLPVRLLFSRRIRNRGGQIAQ